MPGKQIASTDTASESSNIFDLAGTLRRLGGDTSLLSDLVQLYDEDSPGLLNRIVAGLQGNRKEEVRHAAHSLRGLAANFGAAALTEPLLQLEEAAAQGHLENASPLLDQVQQESARLQSTLAQHHR